MTISNNLSEFEPSVFTLEDEFGGEDEPENSGTDDSPGFSIVFKKRSFELQFLTRKSREIGGKK